MQIDTETIFSEHSLHLGHYAEGNRAEVWVIYSQQEICKDSWDGWTNSYEIIREQDRADKKIMLSLKKNGI